MEHYVYVKGLVGLKTNEKRFRWSFGADAPPASEREYEACRIKLVLESVRDREVFTAEEAELRQGRFRYFCGEPGKMELFYSRRLPGGPRLRWVLRVEGDTVYARVGRTYARTVRLKVMNLHPIAYILYELTTALLLRQGYSLLYGSAFTLGAKTALLMAPPSMGKTCTALQLAERYGAKLLGEDILVFDGEKLYPVPWTDSYRSGKDGRPERSALFRDTPAAVDRLIFLDRGEAGGPLDRGEARRRAQLLNRYDLRYYCSPALLALSFLNPQFSLDELIRRENALLDALAARTEASLAAAQAPAEYAALVAGLLADGDGTGAPDGAAPGPAGA